MGVRVKKKVFYSCSLKSTSSFHIITATQTKPMPKRMKKVVSDISYSSSSLEEPSSLPASLSAT